MKDLSKTMSTQVKNDLLNAIKGYFLQERDEEIGDLAAMILLDFFTKELAPHFYNQGVSDAHKFMSEKLDDLFEIQK